MGESPHPDTPAGRSGQASPAGQALPEARVLTDPRAMRALAHPVRMALVEELAIAGELTATQAAALVEESPANCSFHLRQLAKYGFVEESGSGQGRNRPWRLVSTGLTLRSEDVEDEPAAALAMDMLSSLFRERALVRLRRWWTTQSAFPKHWRAAQQMKQTIWWVTPDELQELGDELYALLYRYHERADDPGRRPEGAAPVEFLAFAYPLQMPAVSSSDAERSPTADGVENEGGS